MKKILVKIKGIAPLLQHRFPEEEHGEGASRAKKKEFVPEEECKKALYVNNDGQIYQPSEHILGALIKAGTNFKFEGKKTYKDVIKAGVVIEPEAIVHEIQDWKIDARNVVIQRNRIMRYRPRFDNWALAFKIVILDDNITLPVLKEILEKAGQIGIGDYRPRFGRFMVTEFKELEEEE